MFLADLLTQRRKRKSTEYGESTRKRFKPSTNSFIEMQCKTVDSSTHEVDNKGVPTVIPNEITGASSLKNGKTELKRKGTISEMHVAKKIRRVTHASKK